MEEINFWEKRRSNMSNIYEQLTDPRIKCIGNILEGINSVYASTFFTTFKNTVTALHEADDITLWLKPLVSGLIDIFGFDFKSSAELIYLGYLVSRKCLD